MGEQISATTLPLRLRVKACLVGTRFEMPARTIRACFELPRRLRRPELKSVFREPWCMEECIRRILRPESNCIDVGAHIGSMLSFLRSVAPHGHHVAFEPVAAKAQWLKHRFPDATVHAMALSDRDGTAQFAEDTERSGHSSFSKPGCGGPSKLLYSVEMRRLDAVVSEHIPFDLIKIDVEGAELRVLQGAGRTIERCQPVIIFESTRQAAEPFGYRHPDLYAYITDVLQYDIYVFHDWLNASLPLTAEKFSEAHTYPFRALNFLACPRKLSSEPMSPAERRRLES